MTHESGKDEVEQQGPLIVPSVGQWKAFRRTLDDLGVAEWQQDYPNPGIFDGTWWRIEIVYPDRTMKAQGFNNYPDKDGKPNSNDEWTPTFQGFVDALKKLMRAKTFSPYVPE